MFGGGFFFKILECECEYQYWLTSSRARGLGEWAMSFKSFVWDLEGQVAKY